MWPFKNKQPAQNSAQEFGRQEQAYPFLTHMHKQAAQNALDTAIDQLIGTHPHMTGIGTNTIAMDNINLDNIGLDSVDVDSGAYRLKDAFTNAATNYPDALTGWFAQQGFIGHHMAAMFAQHWLIDKACYIPARDAIRHGFKIDVDGFHITHKGDDINTLNDTIEKTDRIENDVVKAITRANKTFRLNHHMKQFVHFGRIFGIRIALFDVESDDPDYYTKPYNPDGITQGSYKGIRQVDPYWCMPELTQEALNNPASSGFYEPTYWIISGKRYHRTHLCIFRNSDVPDLLKPAYQYGGVPVPQRIAERVYAAERTANEGPLLAMSKRLMVWNTDLRSILQDQTSFLEHMAAFQEYRDNYGAKLIDKDDVIQQFETSLTDVDTLTMSQYQLVAAAANIPVTKLLGTTPKGFNTTGEYDESSYHEELESIQTNDLEPLVERHHELLFRSEIAPKFGLSAQNHDIVIDWEALDSPTAKEYAEINEINSRTDNNLITMGAIDSTNVRQRLMKDPNSGYAGLAMAKPAQKKNLAN